MIRLPSKRTAGTLAAGVALVTSLALPTVAQAAEPDLSLKLAKALRSDRLFMRGGAIYVNIKTKSGETRDVTGPVLSLSDIQNIGQKNASAYNLVNWQYNPSQAALQDAIADGILDAQGRFDTDGDGNGDTLLQDLSAEFVRAQLLSQDPNATGILQNPQVGLPLLSTAMINSGRTELGTPPGLTGVAGKEAGTAGLSIGYFMDDDHTWAVEAYVLAAPLSTSVAIRGRTKPGVGAERPIRIDGQTIATSKLLPPTVLVGRYWGDKDATVRPYTGAIGMYAIFFDSKATETLNSYVGGTNPGDTRVSFKNAAGLGPMLGARISLGDTWHASLNVGHVKLKTKARITTQNSLMTMNAKVVDDLGGSVQDAIRVGELTYGGTNCNKDAAAALFVCEWVKSNGGLTALVSKLVAGDRGSNSLGTYVRETDATLNNTIFMLSVGRTF